MNQIILGICIAAFLSIPKMLHASDGEQLFLTQCVGCHEIGRNAYGPDLCGVVGRPTASADGYEYTNAMKALNTVWTIDLLKEFLLDPIAFAPGTRMGIFGFEDETDRQALVEFLSKVGKEC